MSNTTQHAYSQLLQREELGDALYLPLTIAELGDVAYFWRGTYYTKFNVFEMSKEV